MEVFFMDERPDHYTDGNEQEVHEDVEKNKVWCLWMCHTLISQFFIFVK